MTSNENYNGGEKKWRLIQPLLPFKVPSQLGGGHGREENGFLFLFYIILIFLLF